MKFYFFHLMPYGHLDLDYDTVHPSASIDLPNSYYDPVKGHGLYHRYLDELVLADRLGYDGVCVNEHHQTAYGMMPSPNVLAGALAREVKRAKVCVLGRALPITQNPLVIAEEFAMLDNLTAGRFIAGFVRGIGAEYHASMANPGFSLERFREAHDLIIRAWTETGPFHFEGKHYHFQYVNLWPRPYQTPHPPVWIPSQGSTETVDWAAHPDRRYTYLITFSPAAAVAKNLNAYRARCEAFGYACTPEQLGWAMPLYVAETDEIARREAAPHIEAFFNKFLKSPVEYKAPPGYSSLASYKLVQEQKYKLRTQYLSAETVIDNGMFVCGSPSTVVELMQRRYAEMGFGNLVGMLQFGTLPRELTEKNLRLFAAEVMPKLRPLGLTATPKAAAAE
jgi:alkanesulfonate monooxygenase SsuD/methylene tetrahydromethanopterin reductase-like flavin-dependent oxidoreductase (luciferase family)